jgi:hypothetical protein
MSITDVSLEPGVAAPAQVKAARSVERARWVRVALACVVLAASGGIRAWQVRRIQGVLRDERTAPFPLAQVPLTLGDWRGEPTTIDPKIARGTGATDLITRQYVDQRTGTTLAAIILYGPSTEVYGHVPERCYPTAGFEQVAGPDLRDVRAGRLDVPFRSLVYRKGEGGQADRREVYYSWRYGNGRWSLEIGKFKQLERAGGMFKIHVDRLISERERRDVGNPCEAFLKVLIPELERLLAAAAKPAGAPRGRSGGGAR